ARTQNLVEVLSIPPGDAREYRVEVAKRSQPARQIEAVRSGHALAREDDDWSGHSIGLSGLLPASRGVGHLDPPRGTIGGGGYDRVKAQAPTAEECVYARAEFASPKRRSRLDDTVGLG